MVDLLVIREVYHKRNIELCGMLGNPRRLSLKLIHDLLFTPRIPLFSFVFL